MKLAVPATIVVLLSSTLASAQPAPPPVDLGSLGAGQLRVTWQIGQLDGQSAGFALAPNRAREFARRFGERVTFTVGQSQPADFPFIHPSEKDTAWGGHGIRLDVSQLSACRKHCLDEPGIPIAM